ncbi:hypothetical protein C8J57DRAFT_1529343 [Mycena rebaudengoi]|nr:hypothetical protein C8J57DRAFT_1529343 [Mycena rebaudengoi]
MKIFKNSAPNVPAHRCCDICNPKLFDQVRPSKPVKATRQKGIRKGSPVDSVRQSLFTWRRNIKKMHYPGRPIAAQAILDDASCELLASIGPIENIQPLEQLLSANWSLWERFGNVLYVYLHSLDIPPLPQLPPRKKQAAVVLPQNPAPPPLASQPPAPLPRPPPPPPTAGHKRPHDSQGTLRDTAAPTARRPRIDPGPQTPRPAPRPLYRGSPFLPSPATTSSQQSTSLHPPTTPRTPATYSAPPQYYPYYPPSYPPYQMYGGTNYYLPPAHSPPNATQTPASLRNNPYAAYFTPPTISSPTPNPASSTEKSMPAPNIEQPPD